MNSTDNSSFSVARKTLKKDRKLLLSGVLILTLANIAVKVFGFLYKVPLNSLLRDEMANVNAAYSVYSTLLVVSTAGIPSAVAMLISRSRAKGYARRVKTIFNVSFVALFSVGIFLTCIMLLSAGFISDKNSGGDSFLCMCAIAPSLFFVCITSVYRGCFQGFQIMTPTAVSEIIESFSKMVLGLSLAYLAIRRFNMGQNKAASLSVLGISIGMGLGTLYLMISYHIYLKKGKLHVYQIDNEIRPDKKRVLFDILKVSVPIALSSAVISMSGLVDSQFMRPLLEKFSHDPAYAKMIYSDYSTGAITLFNLPSILIYPIACAIIPFISASIVANDRRGISSVVQSSFKTASLISLPCSFGMSVLSSPILSFIFRGDEGMAENAGPLLAVLAIAVFFIGMLAVSNAVLQAHGKQGKPILSMVAGLIVKVVSACILIPKIGAIGTPISTLLFYVVTSAFNLFFVFKYTRVIISLKKAFIKPLICAVIAAVVAKTVYRFTSNFGDIAVVIAISCSIAVYIVAVLMLKAVDREDIEKLPKGDKISGFLIKLGLLRNM